MNSSRNLYAGYRYPSEVIAHAVWLYHRFCLSFQDVQDLLAERGITVSRETIRQWCLKFGSSYARSLRRRQGRPGDASSRNHVGHHQRPASLLGLFRHSGFVGNIPDYDVTADGERFVLVEAVGASADQSQPTRVHIVQNWYEEFREREQ